MAGSLSLLSLSPPILLTQDCMVIFHNTGPWVCYSPTETFTRTNPPNIKLLNLSFMLLYTLALNCLLNLNPQLFYHIRQYPDSAGNFAFLHTCSKLSYFISAVCLRHQLPYMQISFLQPMGHLPTLKPPQYEPRALHIGF